MNNQSSASFPQKTTGRVRGVFACLVVGTTAAIAACSTAAPGEDASEQTAALTAQPKAIAEVPASSDTTTRLGVVVWKVSKSGDLMITRGYDRAGRALVESSLESKKDSQGRTTVRLTASIPGGRVGALDIGPDGAVTHNSLSDAAPRARAGLDGIAKDFAGHPNTEPDSCGWGAVGVLATCAGGGLACGTLAGCAVGTLACISAYKVFEDQCD